MDQPEPPHTVHTGGRVDALVHRQLLQRLLEEGRSYREWLEAMEAEYLKNHIPPDA